jgi:uncharacterized protein
MPATAGFRVARPMIQIQGRDNAALAESLLSLEVIETTSGLYRCEANFNNWGTKDGNVGFLHFDRSLLEFGKAFQVKLDETSIFQGRIMALEGVFPQGGPPAITALVEDRLQDLRMTRRSRTWQDLSDQDLITQIANDHGLTPNVNLSGAASSVRHRVLAQLNLSDLAFLRERARAVDAEVWVEGSNLNFKSVVERGGAAFELAYGRDIRFRVGMSTRSARSKRPPPSAVCNQNCRAIRLARACW